MAVLILGSTCAIVGVKELNWPVIDNIRGIVGVFLIVTGIQILLWLVGLRSEFMGTSADTDPLPLAYYIDSEIQDFEEAKARVERELELLKLEQKIRDLRSRTRETRS